MASTVNIAVALSEDEKTATIKIGSRTAPIVTGCLGVERLENGRPLKVYLDSLIHRPGKNISYVGYKPTGAISTILTKV